MIKRDVNNFNLEAKQLKDLNNWDKVLDTRLKINWFIYTLEDLKGK